MKKMMSPTITGIDAVYQIDGTRRRPGDPDVWELGAGELSGADEPSGAVGGSAGDMDPWSPAQADQGSGIQNPKNQKPCGVDWRGAGCGVCWRRGCC
jgi:hypothetical protein